MIELQPLVGVIMGSDSDLLIMKSATDILERFEVPFEPRIVSAHRTPDHMINYARTAFSRGLKIIIAGAGGSAHLQGMSASETRIPILGVAVNARNKPLQAGVASQIEMPAGIPLYYMGENEAGATNAALGAVRILSLMDDELGFAYEEYVAELASEVMAKDERLRTGGVASYLES